ncbi:DNA polymerase III subunit delta [Sulfitobacter sp. LCG007]
MKLNARDALGFFAKPDTGRAGVLIYGADAMRVALRRQQMLAALLGAGADEEMRLSRMTGSELRTDSARLLDAVKAIGFFPGARAAFVEDAGDANTEAVRAALSDWQPGDAQVVVTAGALKPASKLRKLFEESRNCVAIGIYDDPPGRAEIEQIVSDAGLARPEGAAMALLEELARALDPGDFRQTIEKIALYKRGDPEPLGPEDIAACAPSSIEADVDDVLVVVADGHTDRIGPVMQRLVSQGATPVGLCIGAMRYFRTLYRVACDPGGRPAVFGPNRDRMMSQARRWGAERLEGALSELTDTDLALRSAAQTAPGMALVERAFIRIAVAGRQRQGEN